MDLDFSQEQVMFRTTCRDFLSKECPSTLVQELERSEEATPRSYGARSLTWGGSA